LTGSLNGGGTVIEAILGEKGNVAIYNGLFSNVVCGMLDGSGNMISVGNGSVIYCELTDISSKFSINNGSYDYTSSFTNCRVSTSTTSGSEGYGGSIYLSLPCYATSSCFLFSGTFLFDSNCLATFGNHIFISACELNNVFNNFYISFILSFFLSFYLFIYFYLFTHISY
jgi:hypothetical protein